MKNMITLADLKKCQKFVVSRVHLTKEVGKRLIDMGFVKGSEGQVIRRALMGDPIQVKIYHYDLSLRLTEARGIEVRMKE